MEERVKNQVMLAGMLLLAACVEMGRGGSGQLTDGTPVIAKATTSGALNDGFHYTLTTLDGLNCTGYLPPRMSMTPSEKMDLDCGNGLKGKAVVTFNDKANIVFKLSDGRQGSASI